MIIRQVRTPIRIFQNHFGPIHACLQRDSLRLLWYSFVASWSCLRLWSRCWRRQWLGRGHITLIGSDIYACNVRFGFCLFLCYLLDNCTCNAIKGLRIVTCAFWRSEALRFVPRIRPCTRLRPKVSDQGTTVCASDLHNARETILNLFNTV